MTLLFAVAATELTAGTIESDYAAYGQLILTQFVSAPFPHPNRAAGFRYKDTFYPADKHYSDSTIAIFIPKGFRVGRKVDFVVHFHGWGSRLSSVLPKFQLVEQFAESRRNAVLIVPQGPCEASDSFGGKLEDPGGFKRFMEETMAILRFGVAGTCCFLKAEIGNIILSGHSGGYHAIAFILAHGGLTHHVREVWLFDGLYGQMDKFASWYGQQPGRFLNMYTERGGTKDETQKLMADLKAKGTDFFAKKELEATAEDLKNNRLILLFSDLSHNDVVNKRNTFCQFLKTSCLAELGQPPSYHRPR